MKTILLCLLSAGLAAGGMELWHRHDSGLKFNPWDAVLDTTPVSLHVTNMAGVPVVYRLERSGRVTMWTFAGAPKVLQEP